MKKTLLLFTVLAMATGSIIGQTTPNVPNNSLENWSNIPLSTAQDPDNWVSFNSLIVMYNFTNGTNRPMSVSKSNVASEGSFAAKIESVNMKDAYPAGFPPGLFPDTAGLLFCGKVDMSTYTVDGFPVQAKYASLKFDYKYEGNGQDSGWVRVVMYKGKQQIGEAELILNNSLNYTSGSVPITYSHALQPDTAMIIFSASNTSGPKMGSVLTVDNVRFDGIISGIDKYSKLDKFEMFPNPATANVTIRASGNKAAFVNITDLTGRVVKEARLQNGQAVVETSEMPSSIYFVSILDEQRGLLNTSKLVKR